MAQPTPPATQPAAANAQADVPVKVVVLFSSGVGYFEHFGSVQGSGSTELRFKTAQINDILKSLVLQDLDGGRVTTITYPSQDPIAKTLRSFQVDITSNPGLAELLNQLRGATVKIAVATQELTGTVLGVEKRTKPAGDGKTVEVPVLNLLTGAAIRSVELPEVRSIELTDPQLQEELTRALAALASARDQDKKPVVLNFAGEGERRVRIGYVVETPIWKTSYRLLLDDPQNANANAEAARPNAGGHLQGWAIVENQTDNDWTNVQLSLVSGRPISFIQDLYQPLYIPRPVVRPELFASLQPQVYGGGMALAGAAVEEAEKQMPASPPAAAPMARRQTRSERGAGGGFGMAADAMPMESMDATASVASVASAAQVGELFQYTVGNVSLPRQKSAMIPIITDPLKVERVSIFNVAVMPKHPLNGAIVTNTTDKHLLQGPITVFDGGSYAGDARIDNLPPGQTRLLSYGVDLQVVADAAKNEQSSAILSGKIVKGVLQLQRRHVHQQTYVFENKAGRARTVVIEHPRMGGDWTLADTAEPFEKTDDVYRFRVAVEPGRKSEVPITQQIVQQEVMAILPADLEQVLVYARSGPIPQPVRDALAEVARRKQALAGIEQQIAEVDQQVNAITAEQTRLRENIRTINDRNDQYYARLLRKLNEQETTLEALQTKRSELQAQLVQARQSLEQFINGLNVG
jgi:hypothetical protein